MIGFFKKVWYAFSDRHAKCLACEHTYAKEAMREIWFKYTGERDGIEVERTSSVYLCEPCAQEITETVEERILETDDGYLDIEVDDDDKPQGL